MEIFTVVVFSRYPLRHFGLKYTSIFRWTLGYVYSAQDLNFCHQHRPYSLSLKFFFRLILRWNTSFWRSTEKRILTDQIRSSHKTSHVRTLWAQYEVMYVGAGRHAGPQTALLNHSSRGHHLYMHHLGTHEITSLTLHSRTDADTTFEGCEAEHECELCPRPVYVCVCLGDIPDPQCCRRCFSSCLTPVWPPSRPENWTPWSPARGPYSNHAHSTIITSRTQNILSRKV